MSALVSSPPWSHLCPQSLFASDDGQTDWLNHEQDQQHATDKQRRKTGTKRQQNSIKRRIAPDNILTTNNKCSTEG
jgi:hypothetical protein